MAIVAALGASAIALSGCAGDDQMAAQYVERPIEQIYAAAWKLIDRVQSGPGPDGLAWAETK